MTRALTYSLAFLLLGGIGAARAVAAAERYRFEPRVTAGDVYETTERVVMNLGVSAAPEAKEAATSFVMTWETKTHREVLAERGGQPTELRLTYLVSSLEMTTAEGKKASMSQPNAGRTFLIRKRKGKVIVTAEDGKLDKATRQGFSDALNLSGPIRFPKVELAPGDDWDVPNAEGDASGKVERTHAKFLGVAEQQGEPLARVQINKSTIQSLSLMPGLSNASTTIRMEGELHYSPARQRPIEMDLGGSIEFTGTMMKDGKEVPFTGSGEGRESYREKWIKIGGKPVAEAVVPNRAQ